MEKSLLELAKKEVETNKSLEEIRVSLVKKGYMEKEVDEALEQLGKHLKSQKHITNKKLSFLFSMKEILDRVGYGFGAQQYLNILFYIIGGSLFLMGFVNGLKSVLNTIISSFMKEYSKVAEISNKTISRFGIIYGFSFLFIALAVTIKSVPLFIVALLIGSVGVVSHGDLYNRLFAERMRRERMGTFLARISFFGIIITGLSMLLSGFIMDKFPITGDYKFFFMGKQYPLFGFLVSFLITSFAFILSGYVLSFVEDNIIDHKIIFGRFVKDHYQRSRSYIIVFSKNKIMFFMLIATVITGVTQVLANSYYGVFIYTTFKYQYLGGFMNVAIIFFLAVITSFFGPWITKQISKYVGEAPMLVFGTLLLSLLPFVIAFNPNLIAIAVANIFSIIGSAILGMAQGLLALRLLSNKERKMYFSALSLVIIIPFILLVPLGAYIAEAVGIQTLYAVVGFTLVAVVVPLYFIMVLVTTKIELVE
ncbi:MAG: MFS transporter [Candidatus Woesearchaeota archaeon]